MFVTDVESSGESFSSLCARYRVSRVTGYKWLERYEEQGAEGLLERSRAPHHAGHALSDALKRLIIAGRQAHPRWGPRKLRAWLKVRHRRLSWCAASTIGQLLKLEGLSVPRVYRRHSVPRVGPLEPYERANQVWCTDFKGWFLLGNRQRCEPWTLSDGWSRYLLRVEALNRPELQAVRRGFEEAFREYGLPEVMRSDNGRPFAGLGIGGLSQLAVWWIKLGIRPERIAPGQPQQNGRHERMHLTLQEVIQPPALTLRGQQHRFRAFRQEFNFERPHEALGQQTPASVYRSSPRPYPARPPEVEYESGVVIKRVHSHGDISWRSQRLFLNQALAGEDVGFEALEDGLWLVRFGWVKLAKWDEKKRQLKELTVREAKE
jgi:putative transposase